MGILWSLFRYAPRPKDLSEINDCAGIVNLVLLPGKDKKAKDTRQYAIAYLPRFMHYKACEVVMEALNNGFIEMDIDVKLCVRNWADKKFNKDYSELTLTDIQSWWNEIKGHPEVIRQKLERERNKELLYIKKNIEEKLETNPPKDVAIAIRQLLEGTHGGDEEVYSKKVREWKNIIKKQVEERISSEQEQLKRKWAKEDEQWWAEERDLSQIKFKNINNSGL